MSQTDFWVQGLGIGSFVFQRFGIWICTHHVGGLEAGDLEAGGLEAGGLEAGGIEAGGIEV